MVIWAMDAERLDDWLRQLEAKANILENINRNFKYPTTLIVYWMVGYGTSGIRTKVTELGAIWAQS